MVLPIHRQDRDAFPTSPQSRNVLTEMIDWISWVSFW
jgi:hypothetical protein